MFNKDLVYIFIPTRNINRNTILQLKCHFCTIGATKWNWVIKTKMFSFWFILNKNSVFYVPQNTASFPNGNQRTDF